MVRLNEKCVGCDDSINEKGDTRFIVDKSSLNNRQSENEYTLHIE